MTQKVEILAAKPGDLSSIPRRDPYTWWKEENFCKLSSDLRMHAVANIAKHSLLLTLKIIH